MLNESTFHDAVLGPISSPFPESPPESAGREFSFNVIDHVVTDAALQTVERYRELDSAVDQFNELDRALFENTWSIPPALESFSPSATQYHLACGPYISDPTCRYVARYEEYLVYFGSDISNNGMTYDLFSEALTEIDTRMSQCLEK